MNECYAEYLVMWSPQSRHMFCQFQAESTTSIEHTSTQSIGWFAVDRCCSSTTSHHQVNGQSCSNDMFHFLRLSDCLYRISYIHALSSFNFSQMADVNVSK